MAALEEERAARRAVEDDELALPAGLPDRARRCRRCAPGGGDLAGEAEDGAVLRVALPVLADVAHHHEVRGRRHQPEGALARAHPLARRLAYWVRRTGRVDAHELEPLVVHPRAYII